MCDKKPASWLDRPFLKGLPINWEHALYILIVIVCLVSRMAMLGYRVESHDESLHTQYSWYIYSGRSYVHNPMMHGPFLFHAAALSFALFGDTDFTARLPVALIGTLLVFFPYLLRRYLGRTGALVASLLFLISPSIMYYSRYIRMDIPTILWAMFVVWAMFRYLEDGADRYLYILAGAFSLMYATKEVAPIYTLFFAVFLVGLFLTQALRQPWERPELENGFLGGAVAAALGGLALVAGALVSGPTEAALPAWAVAGGVVGVLGVGVAVVMLLRGLGGRARAFRSFDLMVLIGTLSLPFASPLLMKLLSKVGALVAGPTPELAAPVWANLAALNVLNYRAPDLYYTAPILALTIAAVVAIGLAWDKRRWPVAAAIYGVIFLVFFTSIFTNGEGILSGWIGSVGYWMEQQSVERGSQPWFYYLAVLPFYDFLPLLGALAAAAVLGVRALLRRAGKLPADAAGSAPARSLFISFLLLWVPLAWLGFSYAGERMPWLTVHLATPMILLTGWLVGRLVSAIDWAAVWAKRGWLLPLLLPALVAALAALVRTDPRAILGGVTASTLTALGGTVAGILGALLLSSILAFVWTDVGGRQAGLLVALTAFLALALLTVRVAVRFSFVNFDRPAELLVYAHNGPDVRTALEQVEALSLRTSDGPQSIEVAYNLDKNSFLLYWYFRDFPNARYYGDQPSREQVRAPVVIAAQPQWGVIEPYLGDEYYTFEYTHYWWPMEDYRELTLGKLWEWLTDAQKRRALWRLFYDMDYTLYDQITGREHVPDAWPLHQKFRLYVRRDLAQQAWDLWEGELPADVSPPAVDPYAENWQELTARQVWGSEGRAPGQFSWPRGVAVAADGTVYVADSQNHRIQAFDAAGTLVATWGSYGECGTGIPAPGTFCEPWDVAVGPDGSVYVADTWAHRVQRFTAEGAFLGAWGAFGQVGVDESDQVVFYGPRSVAVGPDGLVYVTDTGNKRVQVFTPEGERVAVWGELGAAPGQLSEPVGLAFDPDGHLVVADAWNWRVQVLETDGAPVSSWPIDGWVGETIDDKPYLAVDAAGRVYVTDPGNYRVLVFDEEGMYLYGFGQFGFDEASFALPTGIDVGPDGALYVVDA
ncbi:MAG: TIGR03663 family protein, partial [Anaerolineae bacterium]|nr:TIGR03663 family protein [Anaerolineae bacterium]